MAFEVIEKKSQYAVLGLGVFGMNLTFSLIEEGAEVIAIDCDRASVDKIKDKPAVTFVIDTTNEEALLEAGINEVDCAIVCIGNDLVASILTTLILKKFKIPKIMARANTEEHAQILKLIGVNEVIQPEVETGKKLASRLVSLSGYMVSYEQVSREHAIVELKVSKKIADMTLAEIDLRKNFRINVIAVKSMVERLDDEFRSINDYEINEVPDPSVPLRENDILIVIGKLENIKKLHNYLLGK